MYKAIAFYLDHLAEIDRMIEENAMEIERQAALRQTTPTLAELRRRMEAKRTAEASWMACVSCSTTISHMSNEGEDIWELPSIPC